MAVFLEELSTTLAAGSGDEALSGQSFPYRTGVVHRNDALRLANRVQDTRNSAQIGVLQKFFGVLGSTKNGGMTLQLRLDVVGNVRGAGRIYWHASAYLKSWPRYDSKDRNH
jgi:hypothetical protein